MFKPSDVNLLGSFPPLVGTMGRSEREAAAALIVRTCQVNGDIWAPVMPLDCGKMLEADIEARAEPFYTLNRNPVFRPDVNDLVSAGYASWFNGSFPKGGVEFTSKGLAALLRWVTPAEVSLTPYHAAVVDCLDRRHK